MIYGCHCWLFGCVVCPVLGGGLCQEGDYDVDRLCLMIEYREYQWL